MKRLTFLLSLAVLATSAVTLPRSTSACSVVTNGSFSANPANGDRLMPSTPIVTTTAYVASESGGCGGSDDDCGGAPHIIVRAKLHDDRTALRDIGVRFEVVEGSAPSFPKDALTQSAALVEGDIATFIFWVNRNERGFTLKLTPFDGAGNVGPSALARVD